MEMISQIIC